MPAAGVPDRLPPLDKPKSLLAELSFQDPNGETSTVAARVPLWPAAWVVGIRPNGWMQTRDAVKFQAVVLDAAGHAPVHAPRNPDALTDRELEVLRTMARGGSMREVAATLGIAPKTVDNHIQHIYDKIGVRSRAAATLYALEHGLFGPPAPAK